MIIQKMETVISKNTFDISETEFLPLENDIPKIAVISLKKDVYLPEKDFDDNVIPRENEID